MGIKGGTVDNHSSENRSKPRFSLANRVTWPSHSEVPLGEPFVLILEINNVKYFPLTCFSLQSDVEILYSKIILSAFRGTTKIIK